MKFICDAPDGTTWFRIETEAEAATESSEMRHAVDKYFHREQAAARQSYRPASTIFIEQEIGLGAHIQREMPRFLTLRDQDGNALVTAMLPPEGRSADGFRCIVVGPENGDPYVAYREAIEALGQHLGVALDRTSCYPYRRG